MLEVPEKLYKSGNLIWGQAAALSLYGKVGTDAVYTFADYHVSRLKPFFDDYIYLVKPNNNQMHFYKAVETSQPYLYGVNFTIIYLTAFAKDYKGDPFARIALLTVDDGGYSYWTNKPEEIQPFINQWTDYMSKCGTLINPDTFLKTGRRLGYEADFS
jgi:hypothetical protein